MSLHLIFVVFECCFSLLFTSSDGLLSSVSAYQKMLSHVHCSHFIHALTVALSESCCFLIYSASWNFPNVFCSLSLFTDACCAALLRQFCGAVPPLFFCSAAPTAHTVFAFDSILFWSILFSVSSAQLCSPCVLCLCLPSSLPVLRVKLARFVMAWRDSVSLELLASLFSFDSSAFLSILPHTLFLSASYIYCSGRAIRYGFLTFPGTFSGEHASSAAAAPLVCTLLLHCLVSPNVPLQLH